MRVLFVASRFPASSGYGDQVRGFHQLRVLSRRHRIVLVSPGPEGQDGPKAVKAVEPFCERVEIVPAGGWRRVVRLARAPFASLPLQTEYVCDELFRKSVRRLIQDRTIDLLHVQTVRMAPVGVETELWMPRVLDLIDALSVNMAQRAERERGVRRIVAGLEARRIRDYERRLTGQYDQLTISSELDRSAIGKFANVHVVPNGVALEEHRCVSEDRDPASIVFTGTMWYFPNVDAVTWFVRSVFPIVQHSVAGAQLLIVGAKPVVAVKRLAQVAGVVVTGFVPRIQEYLSRATVAIAPMVNGSGMQFKVIEAMASGAAVVATRRALGGLEAVHGEHLLIADSAEEFAASVVRLVCDPRLRSRLVSSARALVEEKYSWERTVARLESVYGMAVADHAVTTT